MLYFRGRGSALRRDGHVGDLDLVAIAKTKVGIRVNDMQIGGDLF
jgi:hypothetical protein